MMKTLKKKIFILTFLLLASGVNYGEDSNNINLKVPEGINQDIYNSFMQPYLEKWESFKVDSENAKKAFQTYFGTNQYRVIWKWDTDGDGKTDYLGVEEYPGIFKGIKRGLLVSEDGIVKMNIDRNKGFYNPDRIIFDFTNVGYHPGEMECIRLLFNRKDVELTKEQILEKKKEKYPIGDLGLIRFQGINKDKKVITGDTRIQAIFECDSIMVFLDDSWKVSYYMFGVGNNPYGAYRYDLKQYRNNKANNLLFDVYNEDPEKLMNQVIGSSENQVLSEKFRLEGFALYKAKNDAEAVKKYEEALKYGESAQLYYDYGNSLSNLPRLDESIAAYSKALTLGYEPKNLAYYNIACVDSRQGKIDDALSNLTLAYDAGYTNIDYMQKDPDLANLRKDGKWAEWVKARK